MSDYYIGNKVFETLTVIVLGNEQKLALKDMGSGIIGVVYVYDNEEAALEDNGFGYTKATEKQQLKDKEIKG